MTERQEHIFFYYFLFSPSFIVTMVILNTNVRATSILGQD